MKSVSNIIGSKLKLIVNKEKSKVCKVNQAKFLGYTIQQNGILTIAEKSAGRLKKKVKTITRRERAGE